jgi:T3SS negative regulator,GrlR
MSKIDGLWSVEFHSNSQNMGGGVVMINQDQILGGDSVFTYTGTLTKENNVLHANIEVSKHWHLPSPSIFGAIDHFNLKLSGNSDPNSLVLSGYVAEDPNQRISIKATHKADLIA